MAQEASEKIAEALGLVDGSFATLVPQCVRYLSEPNEGDIISRPEYEEFVDRLCVYQELATAAQSRYPTISYLLANHLPAIVEAVLLFPSNWEEAKSTPWLDCLYDPQTEIPALHRFIREHKNGPEFVAFLLEHGVKTIPTIDMFKNSDAAVGTWTSLIVISTRALLALHLDRAPSPPFPSSRPLNRLPSLISQALLMLQEAYKAPAEPPAGVRGAQVALTLIKDSLETGFTSSSWVRNTKADKQALIWASCQYCVSCINLREKQRTECRQLKKDEEMDACSRCLAVRYCSAEHQRADWKAHKPFCIKPRW